MPDAIVPLAGQSVRGAVWALANQLGVVAGTPGELIAALTADARRKVVVLPDAHAARDPDAIAELVRALRDLGHIRIVTGKRPAAPDLPRTPPDLDDPAAVCAEDPARVTAAYTHDSDPHDGHGGLRAAWFRAGQSLIRDQPVSGRALVLLAALGDDADPRLRPALTALAADAPWRVDWTRVRGDVTPPWPGPVAALAHGPGRWAGHLLVSDQRGTIRSLDPADAVPAAGSVPMPVRIKALAPLPDGTLLMLDERGSPHTHGRTALTEAVAATLVKHPGTALAATDGLVVAGDRHGSLHAFGLAGMRQAAPHRGRVTSLAVLHDPAPLVCSGGVDGTVRAWSPGRSAQRAPVAERPCPVVALSGNGRTLAVAWADGLVELHRHGTGEILGFHPGASVRALAVPADRSVVIGTDEALIRLTARQAE
ncbi:hypothetical protein [Streptomyces sp. NPDC000410]|uniref:WD40 repeat domain-containing protein n=1 Tax=Streptomyces sp. NPDC000410 TaxID=3154254 RepID=UPI0033339C2A